MVELEYKGKPSVAFKFIRMMILSGHGSFREFHLVHLKL